MSPVHAIAGWDVKQISEDDRLAPGPIMREHSQLIPHVKAPNDIGVLRTRFNFWFSRTSDVLTFIGEGSGVAARKALSRQTEDLTARGYDIQSPALNRGRGQQTQIFPIID